VINADTLIWQSLLKGNEAAFEQLMKLHFKALFNYGTKYTSDVELVKDCIQELFLGIWNKRNQLNTDVNPRPYLLASLRRALHRKLQKEGRLLYNNSGDMSIHFDVEISVEQKIIDSESLLLLKKKMEESLIKLPKRQKEVVYLKYFQNLNRDEIAEIMDIHPQTVSNILQLALKRFRADFQLIVSLLMVVGAFLNFIK